MARVEVVKKPTPGEYIGRGSPLGNPFVLGHDGDRAEVIELYRKWLDGLHRGPSSPVRANVVAELNRLLALARRNNIVRLQCFCKPKACHGDVIKAVLDKHLERGTNVE